MHMTKLENPTLRLITMPDRVLRSRFREGEMPEKIRAVAFPTQTGAFPHADPSRRKHVLMTVLVGETTGSGIFLQLIRGTFSQFEKTQADVRRDFLTKPSSGMCFGRSWRGSGASEPLPRIMRHPGSRIEKSKAPNRANAKSR